MRDYNHEHFAKLISPVYFFLQLSRNAYARYLNNKIFLHAKCIRYANEKVCEVIEQNPALLPDALFGDAIELLNHYRIWMTQFTEHEKQLQPALDDSFIFHHLDNQSAFPKAAEQHFFDYYNELKKKISND